jgi:hypothetical protein
LKTIETVLTVDEQGMATVRMPPDVAPGAHRVVMVIEEELKKPKIPLSFPKHDIGPWPFGPNETFRREDLYGDDGR